MRNKMYKKLLLPLIMIGFVPFSSYATSRLFNKVPNDVRVIKDISYATYKGENLKLDLYLPKTKKPSPLIIWIHGGAFFMGNRTWIVSGAMKQTKRGYALASIEYTLSQKAKWPVQAYELKAAIRWLRANAKKYNLNSKQFIVWGDSAGGHLASIIGTSGGVKALEDLSMGNPHISSRVQAAISWYGPTDFLKMGGSHNNSTSPESKLLGCAVQSCPKLARSANPITYVSADDPPFYIMHGTTDKQVPYNQSTLLYEALQKAKVPVTLVSLPGYSHGDYRFNTGSRIKGVEAFLDGLFK